MPGSFRKSERIVCLWNLANNKTRMAGEEIGDAQRVQERRFLFLLRSSVPRRPGLAARVWAVSQYHVSQSAAGRRGAAAGGRRLAASAPQYRAAARQAGAAWRLYQPRRDLAG